MRHQQKTFNVTAITWFLSSATLSGSALTPDATIVCTRNLHGFKLSGTMPDRWRAVFDCGKKKVILHFKELSFNSEGDPDLLKCPMWSPCWACCPSDKTPYSPSRIFDRCFWKCIDSYNSSNQVKKMVSILLKALSARSLLWSGVQKTLWLWQAVLKFLSQKEEDVISLREILALPICFNNTNNGCT